MKKLEDRPDTFKLLQENEFLKRSLKRIKIGDIKPFEPHIQERLDPEKAYTNYLSG